MAILLKTHHPLAKALFGHSLREYLFGCNNTGINSIDIVWDFLCHNKTITFNEKMLQFGTTSFIYEDSFKQAMQQEIIDIWGSILLPTISPKLQDIMSLEGSYETDNVKINKGDVVVDVGANMGIFSVYAVQKGAGKVYGFEPYSQAQKILQQNIVNNNCQDEIEIIDFALSDNTAPTTFYEAEDCIGGGGIIVAENRHVGESFTIHCITLDEWVAHNKISRIDFIKADIEGAERLMLTGAKETMKKFKPRLAICTYHLPDDPEVLAKLIMDANPKYHIDQRESKLYAC